MGLPFAGHKDNHSGLMTKEQMELFRASMNIRPGHEWDLFEGLDASAEELRAFVDGVPFATQLTPEGRALSAPVMHVPAALPVPKMAGRKMSTQGGFGDILAEIGRGKGELKDLAAHIVTTSPDVTVSTNLGPVGEPARRVRPAHPQRRVPRCETGQRAALGHDAGGPAHRAWHRRAESVSAAGRCGFGARRCTARGCCRSARCTIRSSIAASMR